MHWDNFGWQFWHWWHGWRWYFGFYQWLETNNLWKASLAFFVTLLLCVGITAAMRPWRAWQKHREIQDKIADRLDTSTPGGMADVVKALHRLLDDLDEGDAPDDNGTDIEQAVNRTRKKPRGGHHHVPESGERAEPRAESHVNIPNPMHGGGNAGHR